MAEIIAAASENKKAAPAMMALSVLASTRLPPSKIEACSVPHRPGSFKFGFPRGHANRGATIEWACSNTPAHGSTPDLECAQRLRGRRYRHRLINVADRQEGQAEYGPIALESDRLLQLNNVPTARPDPGLFFFEVHAVRPAGDVI